MKFSVDKQDGLVIYELLEEKLTSLNAPILKNVFIGSSNMQNEFIFNANVEISTLITLFLFFIIPFLSAVLIPVWKIAVIDANESMK